MASNRIRKLGGNYTSGSFKKVVKQLAGRAILVVTVINTHCEECNKLQKFISQLEAGFIDKMQQLVMFYGYNETPLDDEEAKKGKPGRKGQDEEGEGEKKKLSDSRFLHWEEIPEGHGYAVFMGESDVLFYTDTFDHDEYVSNIVDSIRRFKSSIKTIAGLNAKREFIRKGRTGIIIETSGATQNSQIMELEETVNTFGNRLSTPVYFCKGLNQEISYVLKGEVKFRQKGHNFRKFLKKIPKA